MLRISPPDEDKVTIQNRVFVGDVENFVQCVDGIIKPQQLIFIGDSRMRQQFYSFIQTALPDYDRVWKRPEGDLDMILATCHCDLDVTSPLLGLRVSYRFRPLVDAALIELIDELVISNVAAVPRFIFLGNYIFTFVPSNLRYNY